MILFTGREPHNFLIIMTIAAPPLQAAAHHAHLGLTMDRNIEAISRISPANSAFTNPKGGYGVVVQRKNPTRYARRLKQRLTEKQNRQVIEKKNNGFL